MLELLNLVPLQSDEHQHNVTTVQRSSVGQRIALLFSALILMFSYVVTVWASDNNGSGTPDELKFNTSKGLQISLSSRLKPLQINIFHSWTVKLETAAGEAVTGAIIKVAGGMPDHDHGLPTEPRITQELGNGEYLLEGMRFHMNGNWELMLSVQRDEDSEPELATIAFSL